MCVPLHSSLIFAFFYETLFNKKNEQKMIVLWINCSVSYNNYLFQVIFIRVKNTAVMFYFVL